MLTLSRLALALALSLTTACVDDDPNVPTPPGEEGEDPNTPPNNDEVSPDPEGETVPDQGAGCTAQLKADDGSCTP